MRKCTHCGKPNPDGNNFCSSCGKKLLANGGGAGPPAEPSAGRGEPAGPGVTPEAPGTKESKTPRKKINLSILALILPVAALLALAIYVITEEISTFTSMQAVSAAQGTEEENIWVVINGAKGKWQSDQVGDSRGNWHKSDDYWVKIEDIPGGTSSIFACAHLETDTHIITTGVCELKPAGFTANQVVYTMADTNADGISKTITEKFDGEYDNFFLTFNLMPTEQIQIFVDSEKARVGRSKTVAREKMRTESS